MSKRQTSSKSLAGQGSRTFDWLAMETPTENIKFKMKLKDVNKRRANRSFGGTPKGDVILVRLERDYS